MLQVSRIQTYPAKRNGGASGKTIAIAKGNELFPKFFQGGNNFARVPQVFASSRVVYRKLAPGEPRSLSLDSPGAGGYRGTTGSENSLN